MAVRGSVSKLKLIPTPSTATNKSGGVSLMAIAAAFIVVLVLGEILYVHTTKPAESKPGS